MTDREVMLAVFKAVAETYKAVTGSPLKMTVETQAGSIAVSDSAPMLAATNPKAQLD